MKITINGREVTPEEALKVLKDAPKDNHRTRTVREDGKGLFPSQHPHLLNVDGTPKS